MDRIHQDMGRQTMEQMSAERPRGLAVLRRLLEILDRDGIRYLHWKSNEHLLEGMVGMTDLDVLFDRVGLPKLYKAFSEAGFKRFQVTPMRSYPSLEDFIGFDEATGTLVHIHVHHLLRMGEKNAKGYWMPWEDLFLSTRHVQEPEGMYATHPDVEMVIYLLRASLKTRVRDRFLDVVGIDYMAGELSREFDWLRRRADVPRVLQHMSTLLGEDAARVASEILADRPTLHHLLAFKAAATPTLKRFRMYCAPVARLRRWTREAYGLRAAIARRYTHPAKAMNRTNPTGGRMIVFIGSDGSGKSTVTKEITHWLSWKVDVLRVYHGSGDGPSSFLRWPLLLAHRMIPDASRPPAATADGRDAEAARPSVRRAARKLRPVWALVLAFEKRRNLLRAHRARMRGMVVVCDRYPQSQVSGFNDGPLLSHWRESRSAILRALARWEAFPYKWAERVPPDLVFKMTVSPETALARKPGMDRGEVLRRIETIRGLRFPGSIVEEIDADAPLDEVVLQLKRRVWAIL